MPKACWVSAYRAVKDPDKLAAYAKLAGRWFRGVSLRDRTGAIDPHQCNEPVAQFLARRARQDESGHWIEAIEAPPSAAERLN